MRRAVVIAAAAVVALAQIPPAPQRLVWEGMFAPPYVQSPQIVLDMDCVAANECYLAGGSNGVGFGVYKYGGEMEGEITKMMEPNMSLFVTDLGMGGAAGAPKGAFTSIVDFTMGKGLQYLKSGMEWLPSLMPFEIVWASQSIAADSTGDNLVAVGTGFSSDLMVSADAGFSFTSQSLKLPNATDKCASPGSIATAADNAWYLTWGAEPERNNSNNNNGGNNNQYMHRVNTKYLQANEEIVDRKANGQVLLIRNTVTGATRVHTKTVKELRADRLEAVNTADSKCNYYTGGIYKSTDKGKTWTRQFTMPNSNVGFIECGSATNCVAIAFNAGESHTLTTTDGENWAITFTTPPASQQSAETVSAVAFEKSTGQIWVGGSQQSQEAGAGMFWSSNDNGKTWTAYPHVIPDVMAIMSIDFADGVGFAAGITMFKTAQIMRYKKQADYGSFTQAHCPIAGCSFLCQNVTFPQGMCLGAQGGSAKAFCTADGITQYIYETTSCVGSYKKVTQPVNQCLNGTNTFFENYCPSTGAAVAGRAMQPGDVLLH